MRNPLLLIFVLTAALLHAQHRDTLQYAPGYPAYTVSQYDQLRAFPLPRFKPGVTMHRNFPWYDFLYTAYDYSAVTKGPKGNYTYPGWAKPAHAQAAIDLECEMYRHWNYYYTIPTPTYNYAQYANPNSFPGLLAHYADLHPEMKVGAYLFWAGVNPSKAGFDSPKPYIKKFESIDPCGDTTYPMIRRDGKTQRYFLAQLVNAMPHRDSLCKIDFLNENGEVFGPVWTPNGEGYNRNPGIACIQRDSATARRNRGHWQAQVFSTYRDQFIANDSFPALSNTEFSFYQVSAFLPRYYGDYSEVRNVNRAYHGMHYSTPDFYPGDITHNIFDRYAAYHGLDCIAEGRKDEIRLGDTYFAPFVCGGWFSDSLNYRPAQWLAAMKMLGMMGAEYYYPAYFNTANPAQKIPNDPRGYVYQVVMPVYAQAVTTRYADVFFHSRDFVYDKDGDYLLEYRADTLVKGRYAIAAAYFGEKTGTVFPKKCSVDDDRLKINFTSQGATYIYDKSDPANVIFYQLDAWHEPTHPYYWSEDFAFEAEVSDDSFPHLLRTERPANAAANDYTSYTTYVRFSKESQQPLVFHFEPREDADSVYYIWVRARSVLERSSLLLTIDGKERVGITTIHDGAFAWYCVMLRGKPMSFNLSSGKPHELKIEVKESFVEIDKVLISHSAKQPE